jgi:uncharacterized protein (TIGR02145 family)
MKTFSLIITFLLFTNVGLFAQSGMTIQSGGAVTVNGNLIITPADFVCGNPMTDNRDGQTYNTVMIGNQCWMAQNINVGTRINGTVNSTNNGIIEKYCYDNLESNCDVYGGLYQWNEAMQYSTSAGVQGICLTGWHLPTDVEWTILIDFLGSEVVAGGKMKEAGTVHWAPPNSGATNSSGFTALPGGSRDVSGVFLDLTFTSNLWSSSQFDVSMARVIIHDDSGAEVGRMNFQKASGGSVRCLKD